MKYKDEKGNVLYGFSQENLEKTNRELRQTNKYLKLMILMFVILLVIIGGFFAWVEINDIVTKLIYM